MGIWQYSPKPTAENLRWAIRALILLALITLTTPAFDWITEQLTHGSRVSPGMALFYLLEALREGLWVFVIITWKGVWNHRFEFHRTDWYYNIAACWSGILVLSDTLMATHPTSPELFALIPMGLWKIGYLILFLEIIAAIQLLKLPDKLWGLLVPMLVVGIVLNVAHIADVPSRNGLLVSITIQVIILARLRKCLPAFAAENSGVRESGREQLNYSKHR